MVQTKPLAAQISPLIQQQPIEEEEEELQMKRRRGGSAAMADTSNLQGRISSLRGGGLPLSQAERSFFEPRFGCDFSRVRIHKDNRAADTASAVNAQAFTHENNIVFGSGKYSPHSESGKQLLAHELTHYIQQQGGFQSSGLQRKAVAPPAYRDCTAGITGVANANERLENGRQRARGYIGAASRALDSAPAAGTTYATALNRHFIRPTAAQRTAIKANFDRIMRTMIPQDDLIHVCRPFWGLSRTCRAIILVHEGSHDVGVDAAVASHPPNRGDAAYPAGNHPPPVGQTTAGRMTNPDAYAFFAAHIWRGSDTGRTCF